MLKRILKITLIVTGVLILLLLTPIILLRLGVTPEIFDAPTEEVSIYQDLSPIETDSGIFVLGNNWFRQNQYGLWELYIEGDAYNRGVAAGKLSKDLVEYQEQVFVQQINDVIPSKGYQQILLTLIAWINRDLDELISPELCKEIYGISRSASPEFEEYGPAYARILNYHAAHDIGHAMQSYYLVGCSSFAGWDSHSADSGLIVGRNFDFYFGDDFSRHKIIEFVKPDTGINFAFITWGGMAGVVSGMNTEGLTVTINAGTLQIGKKAATPVTLLAREILQFASNTEEATTIAASRDIAVSETFLISSANDRKAILIEKKPGAQDVVQPDSSLLVCTNHFQSGNFENDENNIQNRTQNATGYRFERLTELVDRQTLSPKTTAEILRDKNGLGDIPIGYGNEKALNQFLAHHSVIFKPEQNLMWVSTAPQVMGAYVAYNLDEIFSSEKALKNLPKNVEQLTIPPDSFLHSQAYREYLEYKVLSDQINLAIVNEHPLEDEGIVDRMIDHNSDYYGGYVLAGDYYSNLSECSMASRYYQQALSLEINSEATRNDIIEKLNSCD